MKKTLSGILAAAMALSYVTLPTYAGAQSTSRLKDFANISEDTVEYHSEKYKNETFENLPAPMILSSESAAAVEKVGGEHKYALKTEEGESVQFLFGPKYSSKWDGTSADTSWYNPSSTTVEISTAAQFAGFAKLVTEGKTFKGVTVSLLADIDLDGKEWSPIGMYYDIGDKNETSHVFEGTFNGNFHTVSNMKITTLQGASLGLFSGLDNGGAIKNLFTKDATVYFYNPGDENRIYGMGSIAGAVAKGTVTSCAAFGANLQNTRNDTSEAGSGGIAGVMNSGAKISDCFVRDLYIKGSKNAPSSPIAGEMKDGTSIMNSYATGDLQLLSEGRAYNTPNSWSNGSSVSNYWCTTKFAQDSPQSSHQYRVVSDDVLKKSASSISSAFVTDKHNLNGGYPYFKAYGMGNSVYISADVYCNDGDEFTVKTVDTDGNSVVTFNSSGAKLSDGEWNTIEIYADFETGKGKVKVNNGTSSDVTFTSDGVYGKTVIENTSGGVLFDNVILGTDTEAELKSLYGDLKDELESAEFDNFTGYERPTKLGKYDLVWESSDEETVSNDGQSVTKRAYEQTAVLKASLVRSEFEIPQNAGFDAYFVVTVPALDGATDDAAVEAIIDDYLIDERITNETLTSVTDSLYKLPTSVGGAKIEWESDDTSVIANNGTVNIPSGYDNKTVKLTATVTKGSESDSREFEITVLSAENILNSAKAAVDYENLTSEASTNIKKDLNLPSKGKYGTKITWESDNESAMTDDGFVTRGSANKNVTLTATFTRNGATSAKEFYFQVLATDDVLLEEDLDDFEFEYTEVTEDFELPTTGKYWNSYYTYTSDSDAIVFTDGNAKVTRPENDKTDASVTITLKAVQGTATDTKTFTVTVPKLLTDSELVSKCKEWLTFAKINTSPETAVTENFSLPTKYKDGVTIEWSSSNENVVSKNGTVTRPDVGEQDETVKLTATIKRGEAGDTKEFTFNVKAFFEAKQVVEKAASELVFSKISSEPINMVSKNLTLPTSWKYGTSIEWTSSNSAVINPETGKVTRPDFGKGQSSVTLKAKIKYGGEERERTFKINVVDESSAVTVSYYTFDDVAKQTKYTPSNVEYVYPYIGIDVVDDPDTKNTGNQVGRFYNTPDTSLTNTYEWHFFLDESKGEFEWSMDFYIEKMPETGLRIRNWSGGDGFVLRITPELKVICHTKSWAGSAQASPIQMKKWHHLSIKWNTLTGYWDAKIDNWTAADHLELISGADKAPNYSIDELTMRFENAQLAQEHTVYFDNIKVERKVDYSEFLAAAHDEFELEFLSSQNINNITQNLVIPSVSSFETQVKTESSNTNVVADDGTVTKPDKDTNVTYTVTFYNRWGGEIKREFNLLVKADSAGGGTGTKEDAELVLEDSAEVLETIKKKNTLTSLVSDIVLPTTAKNGSTVTYSSSDTSVISDTGKVTRQSTNKTVTMTAVVTLNNVSERVTFEATVKAAASISQGGNSSPGGSSSSGVSGIPGASETPKPSATPNPEPTQTPSRQTGFDDVPDTHWAAEAVAELCEKEIIDGVGDNKFDPYGSVTREQFLKMLLIAIGADTSSVDKNTDFADVNAEEWYAEYVAYAVKNGIVSGIDDKHFGIGKKITRQDMAKMIYAVLKDKLGQAESDGDFGDAEDIADYAKEAVAALRGAGIVNGDDDGNFNPKDGAIRAEAAQIIFNILNTHGL